ncbi:MAG: OB-fold domain-containing protein, partial [Clostridia bacterium]|nr:OB-fold domain-containing protein [Clostridia bacterium]
DLETQLGDAGAAVTVGTGDGDVLAALQGAVAVNEDFTDHWRTDVDRYVRAGDARFTQDYGFARLVPEVVRALLSQRGLSVGDVAFFAYYAPDARTHQQIAGALGLSEGQAVGRALFDRVGNTGAASPFLALAAALEQARPGDRVVLVGYGSGAEALLLEVGRGVEAFQARRPLSRELARGRILGHYGRYLRFRDLVAQEELRPYASLMLEWREQAANLRLHAPRCNRCAAVQFPPRRVCWQCGARDDFHEVRLSRRGTVVTFTADQLVPNPDPPTIMVSADLQGGGRFYGQLVDCTLDQVHIGMEVELVFRRLHRGGGWYNYFWKFRPVA